MARSRTIARVVGLVVLVPLITSSCSRDRRLPTAMSHEASGPTAASSSIEVESRWPNGVRSRAAAIAEAKGSLLALLTAEQVYFQKFLTFTNVTDTADVRLKLGLDLSEPSRRWAYSVSDASFTGFVAKAVGRDATNAEGLVVTLGYQRGQPLAWKVGHTRRGELQSNELQPGPTGIIEAIARASGVPRFLLDSICAEPSRAPRLPRGWQRG